MKLTTYTRRLEECRKRWHRRTLGYVLEVALIVRAARKAAKDERRWGQWIREETHMNRTTAYRYLRVAKFVKANVSLRKHLVSISIAKLYALSSMNETQALSLIRSGKAERLPDVQFLRLTHHLSPKTPSRITMPNLLKALEASIARLDRSIKRWQHSEIAMPVATRMKLKSRIHSIERAIDRMRGASAVAM